jgi:hypothetical protein
MAFNPYLPFLANEFNLNRESVLGYSLPPFRAGDQPSTSTTTCRYRLRWNQLNLWNDFEHRVLAYWNTVSQADRTAFVAAQTDLQFRWRAIATNPRILSEDDIKASVDSYPIYFHRMAANGDVFGAPLPNDIHAAIDRCTLGAAQWGLVGVPDFVMHYAEVRALMEVKNPWLVTPQQIDEVIDGIL